MRTHVVNGTLLDTDSMSLVGERHLVIDGDTIAEVSETRPDPRGRRPGDRRSGPLRAPRLRRRPRAPCDHHDGLPSAAPAVEHREGARATSRLAEATVLPRVHHRTRHGRRRDRAGPGHRLGSLRRAPHHSGRAGHLPDRRPRRLRHPPSAAEEGGICACQVYSTDLSHVGRWPRCRAQGGANRAAIGQRLHQDHELRGVSPRRPIPSMPSSTRPTRSGPRRSRPTTATPTPRPTPINPRRSRSPSRTGFAASSTATWSMHRPPSAWPNSG